LGRRFAQISCRTAICVSAGASFVDARLHLRPVFVGIERDLIRAAIDADPQAARSRIADTVSPDEFARPDRAGGWIIPLGEERRIIGSA
jgi:hypothetical protein